MGFKNKEEIEKNLGIENVTEVNRQIDDSNVMKKKKLIDNPFVALFHLAISFLVIYYGGTYLGVFLVRKLLSGGCTPEVGFAGFYLVFIGFWIVAFLYWLIFKRNRPLFKTLGAKAEGNNWKVALPLGLILGIGFNLLLALIAMAAGSIRLSFNSFNLLYVLLFIGVITIQSGAEELICRVHLFQHLRKIFPKIPAVAIFGNALIFSALHISNPGVTPLALLNIVLVGILYSLVIYYFNSFWGCVIAHASWNFCQNILLGLPNSGTPSVYSVFTLQGEATKSFAYNVVFGIEGTVTTVVLLAVACVVVYLIGRKRNTKPLDIWN